MEQIVKKEFKDSPDETTPFESEWFNDFQDKIIANFSSCLFFVEDTSDTSTNASTESEE
jgi:hypothetical protein|nr:MAG TPA: hypothetical protein [Caudoviricetes sp.]